MRVGPMHRITKLVAHPVLRKPDSDAQVHVVDDDRDFRKSLCVLLEMPKVTTFRGYGSAQILLADHVQDGCVIADIHMQQMDGLRLLEEFTGETIHWCSS